MIWKVMYKLLLYWFLIVITWYSMVLGEMIYSLMIEKPQNLPLLLLGIGAIYLTIFNGVLPLIFKLWFPEYSKKYTTSIDNIFKVDEIKKGK